MRKGQGLVCVCVCVREKERHTHKDRHINTHGDGDRDGNRGRRVCIKRHVPVSRWWSACVCRRTGPLAHAKWAQAARAVSPRNPLAVSMQVRGARYGGQVQGCKYITPFERSHEKRDSRRPSFFIMKYQMNFDARH